MRSSCKHSTRTIQAFHTSSAIYLVFESGWEMSVQSSPSLSGGSTLRSAIMAGFEGCGCGGCGGGGSIFEASSTLGCFHADCDPSGLGCGIDISSGMRSLFSRLGIGEGFGDDDGRRSRKRTSRVPTGSAELLLPGNDRCFLRFDEVLTLVPEIFGNLQFSP